MSRPDLTPVSYVVLGLVARRPLDPVCPESGGRPGHRPLLAVPAQPDLTPRPGAWPAWGCWPRSARHRPAAAQLPDHRGGRAALAGWLAEPAEELPQFRSLGLLKLFFSQHAGPGDVAELATAQVELHRQIVELTAAIVERLQARPDLPGQLAVAELMGDALPGHGRALGAGRRDRRWLGRPGRRPGR